MSNLLGLNAKSFTLTDKKVYYSNIVRYLFLMIVFDFAIFSYETLIGTFA